MADSYSQPETVPTECTLAKSLAPEDVRVGDFVAPLHETYDFASFMWGCDEMLAKRSETVPVRFVARGSGKPLRVKAVCLPFVLVKNPKGKQFTLDIRRVQLARLTKGYARVAWKAYKKKCQKKSATKATATQKV